ncbi:hypothetical protein BV898_05522 [Hypsibius exemplaris]|uniref:Uncharacterized protein n=1 Tax=Hypsibius exemplaris TaxID=2072580 RepID=A0A1W0WZ53_HYPEX|nr:hypothetical protein BV898_05522 [Hypsibius exemplaris]
MASSSSLLPNGGGEPSSTTSTATVSPVRKTTASPSPVRKTTASPSPVRKASFHTTKEHLDYLATLNDQLQPQGWTACLDRYGRIYYTK